MTETIQQLKEDIAILQMKLQKLEETQMTLEKSGEFSIVSYNGETYYRNLYDGICGGWYKTDTDGEVLYLVEDKTERKLEKLYQEQVVVKEPEKEQKWDVVRESVKWCEEHPDENPLDWVKPQPTDDKNFKNSLDLIKEWGEKNKPPNLKELLWEWWEDIFTRNSDLDADASIDYLVDIIDKKFIPPSSDRNGYEWEKCLKMMRDKLR
jgi:hypothetical protein